MLVGMDVKTAKLEHAIGLGKRIGHFFVALVGEDGFPHLSPARQIERVAENQAAIEEWICPLTVDRLSENPKIAVLIWDPASGEGHEILGEVLTFEDRAFLNGFDPEVEEGLHLPQVKRRQIIRAERITAISRAPLTCDEIQGLMVSRPPSETPSHDESGAEVSVCDFAPEWAEHARFDRSDAPCDDGRSGQSQSFSRP
jgi:hypothetical protein